MRGRLPAGPEYIDKLLGSAEDKERLKAILDTLYGQRRLLEACAELGIGETRFSQLREAALQGALAAIARRPAGRPSRLPETEQVREQRQRIFALERALHTAQVREEIALILPHVGPAESPAAAVGAGKKAQRHRVRKPR
jgi:hypothetical protein